MGEFGRSEPRKQPEPREPAVIKKEIRAAVNAGLVHLLPPEILEQNYGFNQRTQEENVAIYKDAAEGIYHRSSVRLYVPDAKRFRWFAIPNDCVSDLEDASVTGEESTPEELDVSPAMLERAIGARYQMVTMPLENLFDRFSGWRSIESDEFYEAAKPWRALLAECQAIGDRLSGWQPMIPREHLEEFKMEMERKEDLKKQADELRRTLPPPHRGVNKAFTALYRGMAAFYNPDTPPNYELLIDGLETFLQLLRDLELEYYPYAATTAVTQDGKLKFKKRDEDDLPKDMLDMALIEWHSQTHSFLTQYMPWIGIALARLYKLQEEQEKTEEKAE